MNARSVLLICAVAIAGCGSGNPAGVVKQFFQAVADEDYERACGLLAEESRSPASLGGPCESTLVGMVEPNPALVKEIDEGSFKATEDGDRATVTVANELGTYHLAKEDGKWRLTGF